MPDVRQHRGAHPDDPGRFSAKAHPALRAAVADLSLLLSREYASPSALKLVGDRYNLTQRQRTAVMRCACSDRALERRREHEVDAGCLAGRPLLIDGYNLLTTIEAALAGGVIIVGRDGCYRDMASIHGTYRKVEETMPALQLAGQYLAERSVGPTTWYLDSPVSNSGRLKGIILEAADRNGWRWDVRIVANPDPVLSGASDVVGTADSVVLDRCEAWVNLARGIVREKVPGAWVVEIG